MSSLFFTLCSEGTTDEMLIPIIKWVLHQHLGPAVPINYRLAARSGRLDRRIEVALQESAGCDLLVVHRDADHRDGHADRLAEIESAVSELASRRVEVPPHVRVVPVRTSEAWLLFDGEAIRRAAARPNRAVALKLPPRDHDGIADPKRVLGEALDSASGLSGRKLAKFQRDRRPAWVADQIEDFTPLRRLAAFNAFEEEIATFSQTWIGRNG